MVVPALLPVRVLATLLNARENEVYSTLYRSKLPLEKKGSEIYIDLHKLLGMLWKARFTKLPKEPFFDNRIEVNSDWLDTKEAAIYLRTTPGQLRNLTSDGRVPCCKLGNRNRYLKSDLREFLLSTKRGVSHGN